MSDPFDLGSVSVDDLKNCFGMLINKIQHEPVRMDIWIERIEDCKHDLIALCQRNSELFKTVRRQ